MDSLSSDQFQFIYYYFDLLNSIEEGFEYVINSFTNLELTEGDQIFNNLLSAFCQIDTYHSTLLTVFKEDYELLESIKKFDRVIFILENDAPIVTSLDKHHTYVKNQLAPAFIAWKEAMQMQLQPYILH